MMSSYAARRTPHVQRTARITSYGLLRRSAINVITPAAAVTSAASVMAPFSSSLSTLSTLRVERSNPCKVDDLLTEHRGKDETRSHCGK